MITEGQSEKDRNYNDNRGTMNEEQTLH
jgi:hypothetical protein